MSSSSSDFPPVGTLLHAETGTDRMPLACMAEIDARNAAAEALQAYLRAAVFQIPGVPPARFRLKEVRTEWPEDFTKLEFPAAGITTPVVLHDAHNLSPTALEETHGVFGRDTVLWKTAELAIQFQVDFWCTNKPERTAIMAALPALFSPGEGRYGVIVQGPSNYYGRTVRLTLANHERVDSSETVHSRDRQLRTLIVADIDEVHLRRVSLLQPQVWVDGEPTTLERTDPT